MAGRRASGTRRGMKGEKTFLGGVYLRYAASNDALGKAPCSSVPVAAFPGACASTAVGTHRHSAPNSIADVRMDTPGVEHLPAIYQIPISRHQANPIVSQIARFTRDARKPTRHQSPKLT